MKVLNVGSGGGRDLPPIYRGWQQTTLDIDARCRPDVVCDAKEMGKLTGSAYDAVHCSHCLEHFFRHDVPVVLAGFLHVLKPSGFADVAVPDLAALMEAVVQGNRDIEETWYTCGGGPISFHDVLYGWGKQTATGNLWYAHKTGFTAKSLSKAMRRAGFKTVMTASDGCSLHAFAFRTKPSKQTLMRLGI